MAELDAKMVAAGYHVAHIWVRDGNRHRSLCGLVCGRVKRKPGFVCSECAAAQPTTQKGHRIADALRETRANVRRMLGGERG